MWKQTQICTRYIHDHIFSIHNSLPSLKLLTLQHKLSARALLWYLINHRQGELAVILLETRGNITHAHHSQNQGHFLKHLSPSDT